MEVPATSERAGEREPQALLRHVGWREVRAGGALCRGSQPGGAGGVGAEVGGGSQVRIRHTEKLFYDFILLF